MKNFILFPLFLLITNTTPIVAMRTDRTAECEECKHRLKRKGYRKGYRIEKIFGSIITLTNGKQYLVSNGYMKMRNWKKDDYIIAEEKDKKYYRYQSILINTTIDERVEAREW